MTNEEAIKIIKSECYIANLLNLDRTRMVNTALDLAIKALEEVEKYKFEIAECKAILDNPTPDVTENDKKRATYVLQTFPDMRGV
jgi:hypothetical protein